MKFCLTKVGENELGDVVTGVFRLMDTNGMPLDLIKDLLAESGLTIAWDYFIADARKAGWLDSTIVSKMQSVDVPQSLIIAGLREGSVQALLDPDNGR